MCFGVDDRNPMPTIFAKVNVLCEIDEANEFRTIKFGGVVDVIIVVENDFAVYDVKCLFGNDIGYGVGAAYACRSSKLCSKLAVKI